MKERLIVLGICAVVTGCMQGPFAPPGEPVQAVSPTPLRPEAQSVLDRLNAQCASEPWQREIDMIERPETRPENYCTSGEVNAFVSDCKERLAKLNVTVKWNPEKKQYEVDKVQRTDTLERQ